MADERQFYQDVSLRLITPDLLCFSDVLGEGWLSFRFRPLAPGSRCFNQPQEAPCNQDGTDEVCAASQEER